MTGIYFYPHAKEAKSEKLEHVTFQFMCHPSLRAVLHTNINYIKKKKRLEMKQTATLNVAGLPVAW